MTRRFEGRCTNPVCGFLATTSVLPRKLCSSFGPALAVNSRSIRFRSKPSSHTRQRIIKCEEQDDLASENNKEDAFPIFPESRATGDDSKGNDQATGREEKMEEVDENDPMVLGEKLMEAFLKLTKDESALCQPDANDLKMSHTLIRFDENGLAQRDRFVYVEEHDCIGCTHCATTATSTFYLEDEFGRARVFDQEGDVQEIIEEAIDTCPVNCIYYVSWEDLIALELNRQTQVINNWARLVGGQDISSSKGGLRRTTVMDSGIIRCDNCPGRGCETCPMFGVGENPEYLRKTQQREAHQRDGKSNRKRDRRVL